MPTNTTQQCYQLDGSPAQWTYTPCNPSAAYSMCCRTIQEDGAAAPDFCLPNGLCAKVDANIDVGDENQVLHSLSAQTFYAESCSDPLWESEACVTVKTELQSGSACAADDSMNYPLGFCPATGTYCCNTKDYSKSIDCCDTTVEDNMVVNLPIASIVAVTTTTFDGSTYTTALPTLVEAATQIHHSTSSLTDSPTGPTNSAASTNSNAGHSAKLSVEDGIGIGLGSAAILGLIIAAVVYLIRKKTRKGNPLSNEDVLENVHEYHKAPPEPPNMVVAEVHGADRRLEMQDYRYGSRHELR